MSPVNSSSARSAAVLFSNLRRITRQALAFLKTFKKICIYIFRFSRACYIFVSLGINSRYFYSVKHCISIHSPSNHPSIHPITHPPNHPSIQPPFHPNNLPSNHPSIQSAIHPINLPSIHPSIHSPFHPITHPYAHPLIPTFSLPIQPLSYPSLIPSLVTPDQQTLHDQQKTWIYEQFAGKIALLSLNCVCIARSLKVHYVADVRF